MQPSANPQDLLDWASDIGKTYPFQDFHVHPFDVLTGDVEYRLDDQVNGLYHKGSSVYSPPKAQAVREQISSEKMNSEEAINLTSKLAYRNTGPKVLTDQLNLAGLTGALLLPVARLQGGAEKLLKITTQIFPKNGRFFSACAFPIGIPPDKLESFFRSARATCGIRAIKFHPNLTAVDPLTHAGRNLIEAMLAAAGILKLPIVVHGGRTPALQPAECREFGMLTHLSMVDWSISSAPVIIAHAGLYCLTKQEAGTALDLLEGLLEKYPNLMADTSNLEPSNLRLVLERIDPSRLLFGSDALYVPIRDSWIRFLQSLRLASKHPDNDLIRIASLNPKSCLQVDLLHNTVNVDVDR